MVIKPRQENGRLLCSAPPFLRQSFATDKELFGHLLRVALRLEHGGKGVRGRVAERLTEGNSDLGTHS